MFNEIIYKGLRLSSGKCKYFQVKEGPNDSLMEDPRSDVLVLQYSSGSTAKSLSVSLGIPLVGAGNDRMQSSGGIKKINQGRVTIELNGLKLEKLTYDPHIINIIIVDDSESRVVQAYDYTTFVISKDDYKNPEFINYLFYTGQLLFLRPIGPHVEKDWELRNFPKLLIKNSPVSMTSDNEAIFSLRRKYNDYRIRAIDYQDQFILELRKRLEVYGVELVRLNKERTLGRTSYITYQFLQTPTLYSHPKMDAMDIISHRQPVEFILHTTDMVLFHDFKNNYENVTLLTNFTEFKTTDRYGERWSAAVKWQQITEDFNHVYQEDDNSNFAEQCQFRCELYFYEVPDTRYEFLDEIVSRLELE